MMYDVTMLAKILVDDMNVCGLFGYCLFFEYILKVLRYSCLRSLSLPRPTHGQHVSRVQ